jgi:hypothetical protein
MSDTNPTHTKDRQALSGGVQLSRTAAEADKMLGPVCDWAGVSLTDIVTVREDFIKTAGVALPAPWGKVDVSAAGSPTLDFVANAADGVYRLKFDNTDELQSCTLHWADYLAIPSTKRARISWWITIDTTAAGGFSADDRLVCGLAGARNATLDSVVDHAWFRLEGANYNILCETDDGTTDNNDNDTGADWAEATKVKLTVDIDSQAGVRFYVNDVDVTPETMVTSAAVVTDLLQPYLEVQKDAGVETHQFDVDAVEVSWIRS